LAPRTTTIRTAKRANKYLICIIFEEVLREPVG